MIEVAEQERGEGVVVRGDWEGRGGLWREGRLLGAVVVRGVREEGFGCVGVEIMGGGRREEESGVVVWWEGEGQGWAKGGKGRTLALARRRLGNFDLRFFLTDVLEMGWVV